MASLGTRSISPTESLRLTLLRYQAGEVTRARSGGRADHRWRGARNAYDDGLVRYRVALGQSSDPHGGLLADEQDAFHN